MSRVTACRRRTRVATSAIALSLLAVAPAYADPGAPAPSPDPASRVVLSRASAYVVAALTDGDHVVGAYGPDLGQTADVALGLAASGTEPDTLARVLDYLRAHAGAYVHGDPGLGEKEGAGYAGPSAKLALLAAVTGGDPTSFGGIDLLAELGDLSSTSGPDAGRYVDDSAFGDYSNPLGQAFAVLALERASTSGAPQQAVDVLAGAQCFDGGFPAAFGAASCRSSPEATGLALQALVAADADCSAARAMGWLASRQDADGSFVGAAADPAAPAAADVNGTAYAALGLTAAGVSATPTTAYLTSVQNPDGGLPSAPSTTGESNLLATSKALVALAHTSFVGLGPNAPATDAPTCPDARAEAPIQAPTAAAVPPTPASATSAPVARAPRSAPTAGPAPVTSSIPAASRTTASAVAAAPRRRARGSAATSSASTTSPAAAAPTTTDASATAAAPTTPDASPTAGASPTAAVVPSDDNATTYAAAPGTAAVVVPSSPVATGLAHTAANADLPTTGADPLVPVATGFVLVFVGLTLLFAGRRRAGRHA